MTTVEIEYCVPCGFLSRAEEVQHAILTSLRGDVDAVTLRAGADGVFAVRADGETVFAKREDEYDVDRIVRDVRDRLGR